MDKHSKILSLSILFLLTFLLNSSTVQATSGYGWGYKKNHTHEVPDIGKFEAILEKHQAFYVDKSGEKHLYLTFDNGYEQGYTEAILDILKKENVPATFFVTGHYVKTEPKLVKRMVDEGHIVGNHSNSHPDFTMMTKEKMKKELEVVEKAVADISEQKEMKYLRPPRGMFSKETLQWSDELGYIHIFWSLAFNDWNVKGQKGWKYAYDEVMKQIHPGAIILLHAVSSDNAEALAQLIKELRKLGYSFKSLDELMIKENVPNEIYGL